MLLERVAPDTKVYLACGYTDMRMQIDGLASLVINQFQLDPSQNALFLFCGRRRDRIKGLLWEGDGFLLLYKRFESGVYQWPRTTQDLVSLDRKQYRWLLEGLTIAPRKKIEISERKYLD